MPDTNILIAQSFKFLNTLYDELKSKHSPDELEKVVKFEMELTKILKRLYTSKDYAHLADGFGANCRVLAELQYVHTNLMDESIDLNKLYIYPSQEGIKAYRELLLSIPPTHYQYKQL